MIRWIFTFVLLPFFSFSLTRGCNLFSSNFSSISIALHRRGEFFLWCLLCGGFFYSQLSLYRPRQAKCCLLLLTAAALLPYTPEHLPVCAILHTLLALAAALLFLYNLFYLSLQFYLSSPAPARYSQTNSHTAFFTLWILLLPVGASASCFSGFLVFSVWTAGFYRESSTVPWKFAWP